MTATMERQEATDATPSLRDYHHVPPPLHRRRAIWTVAALFVLLIGVAFGAALIGGDSTSTDLGSPGGQGDPADADAASDLLDQAVAMVGEGRADDLCTELSADVSICRRIYGDVDPDRIPTTPPQVAGARVVEPGEIGPAYILTVCGIDGLGDPYVTDFQVVPVGDGAQAPVSPIYWSGVRVRVPDAATDSTAVASIGPDDADANASIPAGCPTAS